MEAPAFHQKRRRTELATPLTNRFVADNDAASREDLLNLAIAQREAEGVPHGMGNNFGGEAVAFVAGSRGGGHGPIIQGCGNLATSRLKLTIPSGFRTAL